MICDQGQRLLTHFHERDVDTCQGWDLRDGIGLIVETDDGNVSGNPERSHFTERLKGSNGRRVIACDQGGKFGARCEHRPRGPVASGNIVHSRRDQAGIGVQSIVGGCRLKRAQARLTIPAIIRVTGDKRDVTMTVENSQVLQSLANAGLVPGGNGGGRLSGGNKEDGIALLSQTLEIL
jgi:hypothetical protein